MQRARQPTVLVQNLEPNDASVNRFSLQLMLDDIIDLRATFPLDKKSKKNNHAYLYFDTDTMACEVAEMLNGHRVGNSILRAMALVEVAVPERATTAPKSFSRDATEPFLKAEWPSLPSLPTLPSSDFCCESDDAASSSTWLSQGSTVKAVSAKSVKQQWCECCKRNTHTTQECRILKYQWKTRGITCGYCKNINDRVVDIHHPIKHKGTTVCPMILRKEASCFTGP